jgi:hypothetical protein
MHQHRSDAGSGRLSDSLTSEDFVVERSLNVWAPTDAAMATSDQRYPSSKIFNPRTRISSALDTH